MKNTILGLVRHLLTFGGGFGVAEGLASQDDMTALVSAVITVVGGVWSIIEKLARKDS
jgi:hypothetical protein